MAAWRCATACWCTARPHWAAAVRARDGRIHVASGRKPDLRPKLLGACPASRGVSQLAEVLAIVPIVKRRLPAAALPLEDGAVLGGDASWSPRSRRPCAARRAHGSAAESLAASARPGAGAARRCAGAELAAYHGVEHKAIGAYEQDGDAADASKEHDRCGSNLVAPLLATTTVGNVALRLRRARGTRRTRSRRIAAAMAVARRAVRLVRAPLAAPASRTSRRPGYEFQRLVGDAGAHGRAARGGAGGARGDPARRRRRAARRRRTLPWRHPPRAARTRPPVGRLRPARRDASATGYYSDAYFIFTRDLLGPRGAIRG